MSTKSIPVNLTDIFSLEIAQQYNVVPVQADDNTVSLWTVTALDGEAGKDLAFLSGRELDVTEVARSTFQEKFEEIYDTGWTPNESTSDSIASSRGVDQYYVKGSVVQQVKTIIDRAIASGVSDIHFEPYENRFRLRYRLDGVLKTMGKLAMRQKEAIISRIKIMADLDIAEKRRPQDGRIRLTEGGQDIDIRVSTLPTEHGEKVVLRILDKGALELSLDALGFGTDVKQQFKRAIQNPFGMILVTGPTGSGKTTTLYAALQQLNSEHVNITTIEDPIEYNLEGINQTHVRSDIGFTFAQALRSFLRQDPDIIMVGEIRDKETAEIAIRAALTGHLVFSTLHTNDAPSAVTRLIDMGVEPFLVASSVRLVMAQRLVRTVCNNCRTSYQPEQVLLEELGVNNKDVDRRFEKGKGCPQCYQTGYSGRTALFELMEIDEQVAEMISSRASIRTLRNYATDNGMQTLREAGIDKLLQNRTTPQEVLKQTAIF